MLFSQFCHLREFFLTISLQSTTFKNLGGYPERDRRSLTKPLFSNVSIVYALQKQLFNCQCHGMVFRFNINYLEAQWVSKFGIQGQLSLGSSPPQSYSLIKLNYFDTQTPAHFQNNLVGFNLNNSLKLINLYCFSFSYDFCLDRDSEQVINKKALKKRKKFILAG